MDGVSTFNPQEAVKKLNALVNEKDTAKREKEFCDIVDAALKADVLRYRADLSATVRKVFAQLDLEGHPVAEELFEAFEERFPNN